MPAWFEPGDPWLTDKMRQVAEIAEAEKKLGPAIEKAVAVFLAAAHARVLRTLPAGRITAAVDLTDWPERDSVWRQALEQFVFPILRTLFSGRYRREVRVTVTVRLGAALDDYLDAVWSKLATFVDDVFAEIREAQHAGDSDAAIADLLRIDAPSRARAKQMRALQDTIDDPSTKDSVRREARSRLAALRRANDRSGMRWWPKIAELARTHALSALNAGTSTGADDESEDSGVPRFKQWWSAEDSRVRPAHVMAHGQVQPVGDRFTVGGFPMAYPGDPLAPPDLTVNCRCSLLTLSRAQAERARAAYEASRSSRTDRAGRAIDDDGRVIGDAARVLNPDEVNMNTDTTTAPALSPATDPAAAPAGFEEGPLVAAGREIPADQSTIGWEGVLAPLGERSPDGRVLAPPEDGQPLTRTMPLPVLYQEKTSPGHDQAQIVGNILDVWVGETDDSAEASAPVLMGRGTFDLGNPVAREVVRQIDGGYHRWVSITHDPDASYTFSFYRDTGEEVPEDQVAVISPFGSFDADDNELVQVRTAHNWRLSDVTLVATPAFQNAAIRLMHDEPDTDEPDEPVEEPDKRVAAAAFAIGDSVALNGRSGEVTALADDGHAQVRLNATGQVITIETGSLSLLTKHHPSTTDPVAASAVEHAAPTTEKRNRAEDSGAAMPGGRYPIENEQDLRNAIRAVGRAGGPEGTEADRAAVRRHIIKRARALGKSDLIPDTWNSNGSLKSPSSNSVQAAIPEPRDQADPVEAGTMAWCERVAAAVPFEPPRDWFSNPKLTGPVKVMVTDTGRVYGHIAAWNTQHAGRADVPSPPRAADRSYSKFHRHPVRLSDGSKIKTGPLATNGHSDINEPSVWKVMAHYDDPRYVVADVVCGEDEHGIWVSGALRPGVTPVQVMMADRYSFSGDWRGNELLAACSASVPGFHLDADEKVKALAASAKDAAMVADGMPRMRIEDGEIVAVIAAGVLPPTMREDVPGDHRIKIGVEFDPSPEEWGQRAFAAWQEAHAEHQSRLDEAHAGETARAERAARIEEFRRRVTSRRRGDLVKLRRRVFGTNDKDTAGDQKVSA